MTFSPDGNTMAWIRYGQTLGFMEVATGKDLRPIASHHSPFVEFFATGLADCGVRVARFECPYTAATRAKARPECVARCATC